MEHLTKQQIVLLTLLVSFVTSIATGIVTVSLINQAPAGTTNTVERIIEDTVAGALPSSGVADVGQSVSPVDSLASAISTISKSTVKIGEYGSTDPGSISGLGVVVNDRGTVMTDKSVTTGLSDIAVTYPDGGSYRAAPVESQVNGDLVFLDPLMPAGQASSTSFIAASIGIFPKLGETVSSLGGSNAAALGVGVVSEIIGPGASSTPSTVSTTIDPSKISFGSPLFDISGSLIGLRTSSLSSASDSEFYLIAPVKAAIPK